MTEYICECGKNFGNSKSHFIRHANKKKSCKKIPIEPLCVESLCVEPLCVEINTSDDKKQDFSCEFCKKFFSRKFTVERHTGICKVKKKMEMEKNIVVGVKDDRMSNIIKQNNKMMLEFDKLKENIFDSSQIVKIDKSIQKLKIDIPANLNLKLSTHFVEKLVQKDLTIQKLKSIQTNNILIKNDNYDEYLDNEYLDNECLDNECLDNECLDNDIFEVKKKITKGKILLVDDKDDVLFNDKTINESKIMLYDDTIMEQNTKKSLINDNITDNITDKHVDLILNGDIIEYRKSDSYVNATQLCKAGGKKFSHWYGLYTTKELISVLASDAGIPASLLVDIKKGNTTEFKQGTWIHPDLAIQLAQWISSKFALQVSYWIRTLFVKGKVELNVKLIKEKDDTIKEKDDIIKKKDLEIQYLKNFYVQKQRRKSYPNSDLCVYILTDKYSENERIYTIGKAKVLIDRLSTYNKSMEHYVIYYKSFKTEQDMESAERIILNKLDEFREQANRDRFILPIDKDIKFFSNILDDIYKCFYVM
jgi:hypothetical protein